MVRNDVGIRRKNSRGIGKKIMSYGFMKAYNSP